MDRRKFIASTASFGAVLAAGCIGPLDSDDDDTNDDSSDNNGDENGDNNGGTTQTISGDEVTIEVSNGEIEVKEMGEVETITITSENGFSPYAEANEVGKSIDMNGGVYKVEVSTATDPVVGGDILARIQFGEVVLELDNWEGTTQSILSQGFEVDDGVLKNTESGAFYEVNFEYEGEIGQYHTFVSDVVGDEENVAFASITGFTSEDSVALSEGNIISDLSKGWLQSDGGTYKYSIEVDSGLFSIDWVKFYGGTEFEILEVEPNEDG